MNNKVKGAGEILRPSLFDYGLYLFIFLCPIFFLKNWDLNMIQGIFFVFGTFALLGLSFLCKKQRDYHNKYIGLIILWSLLNVFIHSFSYSLTKSYFASFINFCLLSEGFIYILCGAIFFNLVVSYRKNFNIAYPILAINILNLIFVILQKFGIKLIWTRIDGICGIFGLAPQMVIFSALSIPLLFNLNRQLIIIPITTMLIGHYGWGYSFSGLFALYVALATYLYIKKHRAFYYWVTLGLLFIFSNFNVFISKAFLRFNLWWYSIKEIISHPIFGSGFDNSLSMNMVNIGRGMMYRHNDYFNIARDLGLPILVFILIPLVILFKKTKFNYLSIAILIMAISCFTWTGMYFSRIACIAIVLLAQKQIEKLEG